MADSKGKLAIEVCENGDQTVIALPRCTTRVLERCLASKRVVYMHTCKPALAAYTQHNGRHDDLMVVILSRVGNAAAQHPLRDTYDVWIVIAETLGHLHNLTVSPLVMCESDRDICGVVHFVDKGHTEG